MADITYRVVETSREGGIDQQGVKTYTRTYLIIASGLDAEPGVIDAHVPFALYDPYPTDPFALLKTRRIAVTGELNVWTATLEWDTAQNDVDRGTVQPGEPGRAPERPGTNNNQTAPDMRPWVIKWGSVQTERVLVEDVSEDLLPVVNSAKQPFDPPVMIPTSNTTLQITAFKASADPAQIKRFKNKVNEKTWLGYAPGYARVTEYTLTSVYENGRFFWQVDVSIEFKPDAWNPVRVLDAGMYEYTDPDGGGLKYRQILDNTGAPVTAPVPLDGEGAQLAAGEDLVYLRFQGYEKADFEKLI